MENNDKVDGVLEEAAKAAAEKEHAEAEAKKAQAAKEAEGEKKPDAPAAKERSLDEMIKDPKIRESIKQQRGWSDAQLDSSYQMAPMQEKIARLETKEKYADLDKYKEFIDKEILNVAIFDRTPQVVERLYWMAKGKDSIANPKKEAPEKKTGVVGERIHTPYPAPSGGSGGDGSGSGKPSTLTDEEKTYAAMLGVPEERYEASKKGYDPVDKRRIRPAPAYKPPQNGNSADVGLGVLLRRR